MLPPSHHASDSRNIEIDDGTCIATTSTTNKSLPKDSAKREQLIRSCENALFATWIYEWLQQAQRTESRVQFTLRKALTSMIHCQIKLDSGQAAKQLSGIGQYLSSRLDQRLTEHIRQGGIWHCPLVSNSNSINVSMDIDQEETNVREDLVPRYVKPSKKSTKPTKTTNAYTPAFKSAPFAVLLALIHPSTSTSNGGFLDKSAIVASGQQFCSQSLESTVNAALTTLITKGLIEKTNNLQAYKLTSQGKQLAKKLFVTISPKNQLLTSSEEENNESDEVMMASDMKHFSDINRFTWKAGTFDVVLLVDLREVKSRTDRDYFMDKLQDHDIKVAQRNLPLGDFLWVAIRKNNFCNNNNNNNKNIALDYFADLAEAVVLDTIIERKTDQDLSSSIPDGRFREQKGRLRHCGLGRIIYLIEESSSGSSEFLKIGWEKYFAARIQTSIVDKFFVRITHGLSETVQFLLNMHKDICQRYLTQDLHFTDSLHYETLNNLFNQNREGNTTEGGDLLMMTMPAFTKLTTKSGNLTVQQVWANQLQGIKGISRERALMLSQQFCTPQSLYDFLTIDPEAINKLAKLSMNANNNSNNNDDKKEKETNRSKEKRLGMVLASRLHALFTKANYAEVN